MNADGNPQAGSLDQRDQKTFEIIINAQKFYVAKSKVSFEEIVGLVFPDAGSDPQNIYSVTYKKGGNENRPEGILVAGATAKIKKGTRFNVSQTGQS